jgi:hypothetical protein
MVNAALLGILLGVIYLWADKNSGAGAENLSRLFRIGDFWDTLR